MATNLTQSSEIKAPFKGLPSTSGRLVFPSNLGDERFNDLPVIHFSCRMSPESGEVINIYLPCPGGVEINDGANYNTIDLGVIGKAASGINKAMDQGVLSTMSDIARSVLDNTSGTEVARLAATGATAGGLGDLASFAAQEVSNPRSNTAFAGNNVRTFAFGFKLIASSAAESEVINNIHKSFRQTVYGEEVHVTSLKYPPRWIIKFLSGFSRNENKFIPKIHLCFLTAINTTLNADANTWRPDHAPLSIDVQLAFQETKVLTRQDIIELEKDKPNREYVTGFEGLKNKLNMEADFVRNLAKEGITTARDFYVKPN